MKRNRNQVGVVLALVAALILGGCASQGGSPKSRSDRNLITAEDFQSLPPNTSLRQVIQRLRPQWLNGRGPSNMRGNAEPVIVYVNGSRSGSDTLDQMRTGDVRQLQFLDAINATQRFGTGHRAGAIMVVTH